MHTFFARTRPFRPWYFGPYPKIQNLAPYFFLALGLRFPKRMPRPCRTKSQGGDRFSRNKPVLDRAVPLRLADQTPMTKNYLYGIGLSLKISSRSFHSFKSYSTFKSGQTDTQSHRQTDTHPPIHVPMGEIFYALFDTFLFTMFALLTLFVKDKLKIKTAIKNSKDHE